MLREECGIVDTDSADEAWSKLREYDDRRCSATRRASTATSAERRAALIGALIGLEVPGRAGPESPRTRSALRELFFSALRSGIEAMARARPLVLAFEDIHWADDGMLDAIEHLAQWVRAPLMMRLPRARRAARAAPELGRRARHGDPARSSTR